MQFNMSTLQSAKCSTMPTAKSEWGCLGTARLVPQHT